MLPAPMFYESAKVRDVYVERAGLIAGLVVIYASHQMRAFDHLEAAILSTCAIDGYQTTRHVRKETTIRIPVTVVLVPFP